MSTKETIITALLAVAAVAVWGYAVVAIARLVIFSRRRRTRSLTTVAQQLGFSFRGTDYPNDARLDVPLVHQGDYDEAKYIMEGSVGGLRTVLFDFTFGGRMGVGKSGRRWSESQSVAAFASPAHRFPAFRLQKKGLVPLARHRVKLEGSPQFSQRFMLTGKDAEGIRKVYGACLVDFLLNASLNGRWRVEGAGQWLVFYRPRKRLLPNAWSGFVEQAFRLATGFFQNAAKAEVAVHASVS